MSVLDLFQFLANVVTVFGLPLAIYFFIHEQRKERDNEDEEAYQLLSDAYTDFMKLVLEHPELKLRTQAATPNLNEDQRERMYVLFEILVALFERAYLTAYSDDMNFQQQRRWHSWDDFMREWCRREDFRAVLPNLLQGEDPDFAAYILRLHREEGAALGSDRVK